MFIIHARIVLTGKGTDGAGGFFEYAETRKIIKRKASELDGTLALFYHKPAKKTLPAETTAIENYIATSWK